MLRTVTSRVGRRVAAAAAAAADKQRRLVGGAEVEVFVFGRGGRWCSRSSSSSTQQPPPSASASAAAASSSCSSSSSIAGENTKEFLVKVPDAAMAEALNAEQSGIRDQLITLTSVAAAVYLGYFILPLVGGGTAGSAVQLLKSKDTLFQKTGLSRLRMIHKAGQASYMAPAVEQEGIETLLHLIVSGAAVANGGGGGGGGWRNKKSGGGAGAGAGAEVGAADGAAGRVAAVREVAEEALDCLMELGTSEEVLELMAARTGLTAAVSLASRDKKLRKDVRARLDELHAKLIKLAAAAAAKAGGGGR